MSPSGSVANWWRLFHEVENERTPRGDFAETHDLAFAGEGFLLPSLTIAPTPQKMRLRWKRYRPLHSEIEFTEQGEALVDRHDFGEAVQTIVEATRGRRGHDLAQAARAQLAPASDRYDFAADGPNALPFVEMQPPPHCHIQGLVAADSPVCAIAARGTARRFLQARALGDYPGRAEHGPAILSGLVTDRQAQSRAFAAEFLAPAASLGRRLRGRHTHPDEVDELAAAFGVSSYVVRHQIQNHGLADCTEW